ncbi:DnaT-like ssDNA-binding domain-containing protein [Anaerobiospirillum thomasii]|uniref:DnaT DNA-binding domain-containing protein n=1 Tax=Anaerobiospirillum thomasii TaxID=179995 RepID=A0A2X0WTH5_9GAMM|nr:DnaT-like ssDNA-binding domain-containing protein [Anaerobiospirillum thomasii]SPT69832.1 Uncharacterised protein [Anaerobiospirillum thomasii]
MTSAEFEALASRSLSHQSRSLYIFYLRNKAVMGDVLIDYGAMSDALVSTSQYCPFAADSTLIDSLLHELEYHGLIAFKERLIQGMMHRVIVLPYLEMEQRSLPQKPFIMHSSWRPGPSFVHAAKVSGLMDPSFSEKDLQSFIAYWSQKSESRNQAAWERAFVLRLKRMRQDGVSVRHKAVSASSPIRGYDVFGNPFY